MNNDKIPVCILTVYKSLTNLMKPAVIHSDNAHGITLTVLITTTSVLYPIFIQQAHQNS